jgi:putrescine transport system permease protein
MSAESPALPAAPATAADGSEPSRRSDGRLFRRVVVGLPFAWLLLLFLVPFLLVLKISLSTLALGLPPYEPVFPLSEIASFGTRVRELTLDNYRFLTEDPLYLDSLVSSLVTASVSTLLALLVAYPFALGLARAPDGVRPVLLVLTILPFWTSFLIRVYAWMGILRNEGFLNQLLLWLGIIDQPLVILNTNAAVYIGIVYSYLPFMVLPIYASLERQDPRLLEAAADLGSPPARAFWQVTLPLSLPGVFAGCLLVFIPAVGEFVIPDLLGGSETLMIGKTLWNEFFINRDWPLASAVAVVLLVLLVGPILLLQRARSGVGGAL